MSTLNESIAEENEIAHQAKPHWFRTIVLPQAQGHAISNGIDFHNKWKPMDKKKKKESFEAKAQ